MSERDGTSRRDFLKVLGVAGAGTAAAACSPPETTDRLLPYLVDPDEPAPGESTTYATLLAEDGPEPLGLHARVRDGRAIKLEGNPDFPTNRGKLSALGQSALQDLYDPDRIRGPRRAGADGLEEAGWDEALSAAGQAVAGGGVVLLTPALTGTRGRLHAAWAEAAGAEHVRYEPLTHRTQRQAHQIVFGRAEIPEYAIDRADRIVSFGADFLGTWLAPVELGRRFAEARDVDAGRHAKLTFVGPRLSLTGTNADEWLPARSGRAGLVALAVAHVVTQIRGGPAVNETGRLLVPYTPTWAAERTGVSAAKIQTVGEELAAADHPLALPPGHESRDAMATDAHVAVALLNYVCGATGDTVRFGVGPERGEPDSFRRFTDLVARMEEGAVRTLVVAGPNPAFTAPSSSGFEEALESVETVISLSSHPDETTVAADWVLPSHHELESWGDAVVRPGVRALGQPVMQPVFDTRQREDILMALAGSAGLEADFGGAESFAEYLQAAWRELHAREAPGTGFGAWWRERLKAGGLFPEEPPRPEGVSLTARATSYDFAVREAPSDESFDLVVYPTPQLWDGRGANRGWMQELPDPVTKVVWNSWVEMHPETAEPLGLENGDVVEVRSSAGAVRAPVYLFRGIRPDAVAIPMGQGHTACGRNAEGRGVNPLDLLPTATDARSGALALAGVRVEVVATGESERLVTAQGSDVDHEREVAETMQVGAAREAVEAHEVDLAEMVEAAWDSDPQSPYRWGMTIDLNACTGCGACVTACYAENNLPVVGEENFDEGREMSWLRVERYWEEQADGGFQTVHEPMLCQHCGDAPCEPVCPVYATYHNPEGLNVQVYNRCVGTRYCSNNCPYKVRRFNWFDYEFPYPLNLQLNPDVTVRDKGVMEKCTFCVQRINRAKIEAKEEGRLVRDGEVTTACQGSCPTDAITFGNLKDPTSEVSQIAKGARSYHVLDELHTRPAVTYLKDVTHAEMAHGDGHGGEDGGDGHG